MKKIVQIEVDGIERAAALVTKFGYLSLPIGTKMYSLDGRLAIVGEDEVDQEELIEGYLKYGILEEDND